VKNVNFLSFFHFFSEEYIKQEFRGLVRCDFPTFKVDDITNWLQISQKKMF